MSALDSLRDVVQLMPFRSFQPWPHIRTREYHGKANVPKSRLLRVSYRWSFRTQVRAGSLATVEVKGYEIEVELFGYVRTIMTARTHLVRSPPTRAG